MASSSLELLTRADTLLQRATTLPVVMETLTMADQARHLAQALDLGASAMNHCTAIKVKCERRLADLIDKGQAEGEIATRATSRKASTPNSGVETLASLGVDSQRLSEARAIRDQYDETDIDAIEAEANAQGLEVSRGAFVAGTAHVSHNSGAIEWYTPEKWIEAARKVMGGIDLDPASCAEANEVVDAAVFYSEEDDGLAHAWAGRVWMNPPYASDLIKAFCAKLVGEVADKNVTEACALVNNATETGWFQTLARDADALCFPLGRIKFWRQDLDSKTPLQGQCVVYFGPNAEVFREVFGAFGLTVAP